MPGAQREWHELQQFTVAPDERVRRDARAGEGREIGVGRARQRAAEQAFDPWSAEITGRQADAVHDDELGHRARGALVAVRGEHLPHATRQAERRVDFKFAMRGHGA